MFWLSNLSEIYPTVLSSAYLLLVLLDNCLAGSVASLVHDKCKLSKFIEHILENEIFYKISVSQNKYQTAENIRDITLQKQSSDYLRLMKLTRSHKVPT